MTEEKINLFIVADNILVVNGLKHYLEARFGDSICISNFYDSRSCLKKINDRIQMVVLDYFISGRSATETHNTIKKINPKTRVIMHSSNEEVAASIEEYQTSRSGQFGRKTVLELQNQNN